MTPRDAAQLLIAAVCSQDVQDSVETVSRYGKLNQSGRAVSEDSFPALAKLGDSHSFAEALAVLLSEESVQFLADDPRSTVFVTLSYPNPEVKLEIATHGAEIERDYSRPWLRKEVIESKRPGDLHMTYRFTEQTIFRVGNLLRGEK
jgi:hypothetical protein